MIDRGAIWQAHQDIDRGDITAAHELAAKLISEYPKEEEGWALAARIAPSRGQAQACLRNVHEFAASDMMTEWAIRNLQRLIAEIEGLKEGRVKPLAPGEILDISHPPRIGVSSNLPMTSLEEPKAKLNPLIPLAIISPAGALVAGVMKSAVDKTIKEQNESNSSRASTIPDEVIIPEAPAPSPMQARPYDPLRHTETRSYDQIEREMRAQGKTNIWKSQRKKRSTFSFISVFGAIVSAFVFIFLAALGFPTLMAAGGAFAVGISIMGLDYLLG